MADLQNSGVGYGWGTAYAEKQEAELHGRPSAQPWHVSSVRTSIEREEGPQDWPGDNWVKEPEDLDPYGSFKCLTGRSRPLPLSRGEQPVFAWRPSEPLPLDRASQSLILN